MKIKLVSSLILVCIQSDVSALQDMYDDDCVSSMMSVYIQCDDSSLSNTCMMRNLIPGCNV